MTGIFDATEEQRARWEEENRRQLMRDAATTTNPSSPLRVVTHAIEDPVTSTQLIRYSLCGLLLVLEHNLHRIRSSLAQRVVVSKTGDNWLTLYEVLAGSESIDCTLCRRVVYTAVSEHRKRVAEKRRRKGTTTIEVTGARDNPDDHPSTE